MSGEKGKSHAQGELLQIAKLYSRTLPYKPQPGTFGHLLAADESFAKAGGPAPAHRVKFFC